MSLGMMQGVVDVLGCAAGVASAIAWFMSAAVKLPAPGSYWDQIPMDDPFFTALRKGARINTYAAAFSGIAALCAAAKFVWNL